MPFPTRLRAFRTALFLALLALSSSAHAFYAEVVIESAGGVRLTYLQQATATEGECARQVLAVSQAVLDACPACRLARQQCRPTLSPRQKLLLNAESADVHLVRLSR